MVSRIKNESRFLVRTIEKGEKMKKLTLIIAAAVMSINICASAFAGNWQGSNETGWMWIRDDGTAMTNGWTWADGDGDGIAESYYFDAAGICLTGGGTTPDGYTINETGAWVQNGAVMHKNMSTGEVYSDNSASAAKTGSSTGAPVPANSGLMQSMNLEDYQGTYEAKFSYGLYDSSIDYLYGWLEIDGNRVTLINYDGEVVRTVSFNPDGSLASKGKQIVWKSGLKNVYLIKRYVEIGGTEYEVIGLLLDSDIDHLLCFMK